MYTDEQILATLKRSSYFRAAFPEQADLSDKEIAVKIAAYERYQSRGTPDISYSLAKVDLTKIALEILALTALLGFGLVLTHSRRQTGSPGGNGKPRQQP